MVLKKEGINARAQEIDGEFTVLQESLARHSWIGAPDHAYRALRETLEKDGTLSPSGGGHTQRFTHDQVFASPSAAAAAVAGRTSNGRKEWRLPSGLTYGEWQNSQIEPATAALHFEEE